jgi:hypothetical protein
MYGEGRRVSKNGEEEHTKNYGRHIRIQWLKDRVLISSLVLPVHVCRNTPGGISSL